MTNDSLKRANEIKHEIDELKDFYAKCIKMKDDWEYIVSIRLKRWCRFYGCAEKEIYVPKSVERELMSCLRDAADKKIRELRDEFSSI